MPLDRLLLLLLTILAVQTAHATRRETIAAGSFCGSDLGTEMSDGHTLLLAGRFDESIAAFRAALDSETSDPVKRACLMNMIGYVELQQRSPGPASEWFQRALELESLPGALLVGVTSNLANAYLGLRDLDQAEATARRALDLAADALAPEHEETLFPQATLAAVYFMRGDVVRAEPVCRRMLHQAEKRWGEVSYEVTQAAGNLAMIYLQQRRYTQAAPLFEKALLGLRNSPMRVKGELPATEAGLAVCHASVGRARNAESLLKQALASAAAELDHADPSYAVVLERGANVGFLLKDFESGRRLFERSIAILESTYGAGSQPVLGALERYSALLRAAKDHKRAGQVDRRRRALD
jgi:tetratricopeptide (TPR) repeat protein